MHQEKLSIRFIIYSSKLNKQGVCPIYLRLTYKKKRTQFSTGQFVNPNDWNSKKQLAISNSKNNSILNAELALIKSKVEKAYLKLQLEDNDFTVDDILLKYLNKKIKKEDGVVSYFKKYLAKQEKLIGKDIQQATWNKFNYVCNHVTSFIYSKYKKKDYSLENLNQQFLDDFEYYLKAVKNQKQVTINKSIQRFRKAIKIAVSEGYLDKDPFMLHKPKRVIKNVVFLSQIELEKIEHHGFRQSRLELVRDLFIFCCYTGLAYNEMNNLKKHHIIDGFDGNKWIQMKRQKTGKDISVPLLPKAAEIIEKYTSESEYVLPKLSNQRINSYLKEIAGIIGVEKRITHHTARKTFASTVLLYNNVPMEIVSELLGHSSISITEDYYGKVVQKRVSDEMKKLNKKINKQKRPKL